MLSKEDTQELIDILTGDDNRTDIEKFTELFDNVGIDYEIIKSDGDNTMIRLKELDCGYYIFEFDMNDNFVRNY